VTAAISPEQHDWSRGCWSATDEFRGCEAICTLARWLDLRAPASGKAASLFLTPRHRLRTLRRAKMGIADIPAPRGGVGQPALLDAGPDRPKR
jgi:hypothetical protein